MDSLPHQDESRPANSASGLVVAWKERSQSEPVAQLVEQRPFKAWVVRSIRTGLTTLDRDP